MGMDRLLGETTHKIDFAPLLKMGLLKGKEFASLGSRFFPFRVDSFMPALVAQFDARLTGDEEVADSTPAGLATFCCGD